MSLPEGCVQIELFNNEEIAIAKPKKPNKDYTTSENPMVRKYGLTWNKAKCGGTSRTKPCQTL